MPGQEFSCPRPAVQGRSRMRGMAVIPTAGSLIFVSVLLRSMGYCSGEKTIRIEGFGSGRSSVFLLLILQVEP